jgi:phage shock protein PspC (stress-responsive transcriptional regulator)
MQKVVSISLNGIAYQLEEPGFNRLRDYLERAEARLAESPDRAEVMGDLEQAVGEKCARALGPHKTVVSSSEIERIIEEMGPVESADDKPADTSSETGTLAGPPLAPRKRLYNVREGAMWAGVCNGLGAYLNVDVTWVRLAFVVLTFLTSGAMLVVYFVMMFIVPYANTAEERAAAFGAPFSTQEFLDRAKKKLEGFGNDERWRREWRRQQRHWNRQFQHMNEQLRQTTANVAPRMTAAAHGAMALLLPLVAIVGAIVFVVWILAMLSVIAQQSIFGWQLPFGWPVWGTLVMLVLVYVAISSVLKFIRHGGVYAARHRHPGWSALHTAMWIGFTVFIFYIAYRFFPGVRELLDHLMWAADLTVRTISDTMVAMSL